MGKITPSSGIDAVDQYTPSDKGGVRPNRVSPSPLDQSDNIVAFDPYGTYPDITNADGQAPQESIAGADARVGADAIEDFMAFPGCNSQGYGIGYGT